MTIKTKCSHCGEEYNLKDELLWKKAKCKVCKEEFEIVDSSLEVKKEKIIFQKSPDLELKPNKISFILFSNQLIVIFSIIAVVFLFIFSYVSIILFILVWLLFAWENIKWKKEKYNLTDRKIIFDNWNLISDNSTEINLDKITQVKVNLPFLQHLLFKTGNLYIQTAWAWSAKIRFSNISNTMELYEEFRLRMQKNGFHLQKDKLVQTEKPHMIWIILEVFWKIIWALFFVYLIFIWIISGAGLWKDLWILSILAIVALIWVVAFIVITYFDLSRRKYEIFTDSIWYHEWFLSKHYAFIPMEVVADVENTQSFFSKIFGLHDIIISSAWTSNKVKFKNMVNWEKMIENIRYLKEHITMSEKDSIEGEEKTANSLIWFKDKIEDPLDFDKDFEGHYKMDILKTLFEMSPLLLFFIPLLFLWAEEFISAIPIIIIIWALRIIKLIFTDYNIRKTTIEKKFELFSLKFNSFTIEKITGVQIKQSFVDKWFWTCSVKFWSIGSGTPITFENIKKTKGLEEQILAKVWIRKEEKISDIETDFNFMNFVKANILWVLFMIILFPVTILVFIYKKIFFAKKRYLREIYKNYIKTQNWIFFITKKYVLFRHIKWIKSTKFPFTNTWKLLLNVAWEVQVESKTQWQALWNFAKWTWAWIFSNSVDIDYIKNVFESHDKLDNILNWKEINTEKLSEAKQDIVNTIILMILFIFPIIFIPLVIWFIKVQYWVLEKNRVLFWSWIIYKKRQTILYHRFNFIDLKRWFLNKIFKNGSVNIYTIWSSSVDMNIPNIDNYSEIYELLKKD